MDSFVLLKQDVARVHLVKPVFVLTDEPDLKRD
jgi:hypothetical protein